jgi:phenylalanyl-tRNA synthetase beta chain
LRQAEVLRRALADAGLNEVVSLSFVDPAHEAALGRDPERESVVRLRNPLSQDASLLRSDLLPGLLRAVAVNVRRQQPAVRIFEIGTVFEAVDGKPRESRWLGMALIGARGHPAWHAPATPVDVYDAKGLAEHALAALGIRETALDATPSGGPHEAFEEGCVGWLVAAGTRVACFGEVALRARETFEIGAPVFAALIPLDVAIGIVPAPVRFVPLPRYPGVERDVAFVVPLTIPAAEIAQVIRQEGAPLLRSLALFDLYAGEGIDASARSLAWRLTFRAADRTLTDAEVNELHGRVIEAVRRRFGVEVRGGA